MLYRINDIEPKTEKAKGLIKLHQMGLNIPLTILFNSKKDIKNVLEYINLYKEEVKTFYIRFNFSDNEYPHHLACFASIHNMYEKLSQMFISIEKIKKQNFDVIIQPMLKTDWSGGIMVKGNNLLIEIVQGNPRLLFRNGFFHKRILFNRNFEKIFELTGVQPFTFMFNDKNHKLEKIPFTNFEYYYLDLKNYYKKLKNNCLYEFTFSNNQIIFLQEKQNFVDAYFQIENDTILLPFVVFENKANSNNTITYDFPSFEYINQCDETCNIVIKQGAYLSHLASYLAERKVHCEFLS